MSDRSGYRSTMEHFLMVEDKVPADITLSRLASLVKGDHDEITTAEKRLNKAKRKTGSGLEATFDRVIETAGTGDNLLSVNVMENESEDAASLDFTFHPKDKKNKQANAVPMETVDAGVASPEPASSKPAPKIRVSFRPTLDPKPAWDGRKTKPMKEMLEVDQAKLSPPASPSKKRVQKESKTFKELLPAGGAVSQKKERSESTERPVSESKIKARKASLAVRDPFDVAFGGVAQLDSVRRVVKHTDMAEMRRLEDMLAKVREAVEVERQAMAAERAQTEASCAGVLERAAHSWLRIWQVQRVYAGSKEAALLALPWRGHLSFPFLHWKKSAHQKAKSRRQRRTADLKYKRNLFKRWRQAGQLSAGLAVSVSAFERRRERCQQRGTLRAWKAMIDNRKTAQFMLRKYVDTWQANRLQQAWQRWRAGVEVRQSKKAHLARARHHIQTILVRAAFKEWLGCVFSSAHAREVMRNSSERLQQRALLRAFQGWREAVTEVQRQRGIMHRAAAHIMHSALAQAFSAWVAKTELQRSVRRFAALLRNRAQLSAFNTWRAAVQDGRQMEQDLHQVFAHRREEFAGEMLSRWRAWRSGGGGSEESGATSALRRCFRRWRGVLQDKRQLRAHARRMARTRIFRQWRAHTRWAKNLQMTTLKKRAFQRWSDWTSMRVRGKSLSTLEAELASSEERAQELRAQLKRMQEERDAANQRAADLVTAVKGLDWKLRSAAAAGSASPPRSPRKHTVQPGHVKLDPWGKGVMSRPNESLLELL